MFKLVYNYNMSHQRPRAQSGSQVYEYVWSSIQILKIPARIYGRGIGILCPIPATRVVCDLNWWISRTDKITGNENLR
jgi:hypothetical protein